MADFNDIKAICRNHNIVIEHGHAPFDPNSAIYSWPPTRTIYMDDDWSGSNDPDDLFVMLTMIGWILEDTDSDYEREKSATLWAIPKAAELGLQVSHSTLLSTQADLDEYEEDEQYIYDFDSIARDHRLQDLMDQYDFPLFVQKPSWTPNFYFRAEYLDSTGFVRGTAFRNGKEYTAKEYKYRPTDVMHLYGDDNKRKNSDLDFNDSIKTRIKTNDSFDDVETEDQFLFNHQRAGLLLAERYNKFAFFYDTGTGKTIMALSVIKQKFEEENAHFLIVAPKAIIRTAWLEDAEHFFPGMRILPLSNNFGLSDWEKLYWQWVNNSDSSEAFPITQKMWDTVLNDWDSPTWSIVHNYVRDKMLDLADHYIINIEKFRSDPDAYLDEYELDGIVIDESAILKNPNSVSSKVMMYCADSFDYIYLLSGKPAPNNSTEYYAQMKLVDPNAFGMSFNSFKSQYFTGSGSKLKFISASHEKAVADLVARRSITISKEDCITLPEVFHESICVTLPASVMSKYNKLYRDCIIEIQKQDELRRKENLYYSTTCRLAVFTKLREVASGFMMDEYRQVADLHNEKTKALKKIVDRHSNEQVVVWCQFEHEIKTVEKALSPYGRVVTAYGKTRNIDQSIKDFKDGKAKYIIAHPKSIKYGVTFTNCCIAIYYSMSYSAEDYYQSRDRIYRLGQKRNCNYYYLLSHDTIDEVMFECVQNKMSYAEIFSAIVKQAAKHGIDYSTFKDENEVPDESIATQLVNETYHFAVLEDNRFEFSEGQNQYEGPLYNLMLSEKKTLNPEEILFEIMFYKRTADLLEPINYITVVDVAKDVLSEMKRLHIKKIQKVFDYLEEQILNQYEQDVANGAEQILDPEALSLKELKGEGGQKKFSFGKI